MACGGQPLASSPVGQALREIRPVPLPQGRTETLCPLRFDWAGIAPALAVWWLHGISLSCTTSQTNAEATYLRVTVHDANQRWSHLTSRSFSNPVDPCPRRLVSPSILLADVPLNPLSLSPLADNLTRASSEATNHHNHQKRQTAIEHWPVSFFVVPSSPLVQCEPSPVP
jgi:hypothetical protein